MWCKCNQSSNASNCLISLQRRLAITGIRDRNALSSSPIAPFARCQGQERHCLHTVAMTNYTQATGESSRWPSVANWSIGTTVLARNCSTAMQEPAAYPTETPSNGYVTTPSLNPRVRRAEISEKISRTANDRGEHGLMAVWVPWHQARRLAPCLVAKILGGKIL